MVLSREFELTLAYCRAAFSDEPGADARGTVDWDLFLRLVRFHRVQGVVWSGLGRTHRAHAIPVAKEIERDAVRIATDNLRMAAECRRLEQGLTSVGIAHLFVKGLTLGKLAYGGIGTKAGVDIDLLIAEDQLLGSAELLQRSGYCLKRARLGRLAAWHQAGKESTWVHDAGSTTIDLHTRLSDHRSLLPTLDVDAPWQLVEIAPGVTLPTLEDEELFAYLCVHGASSAWFRLKWVTDLAAFLKARSDRIPRFYQRSQELGAGRTAGQALLLADTLYGTLDGHHELRQELNRDRWTRWLFRAALQQLAGNREPVEPTARALGTARIHFTQLALLPGWRFPFSEAVRQIRAAMR